MAQIVVDSTVMREKAQIIQEAGEKILELYSEMENEVNTTAGKMKGATIETQQRQFGNMRKAFETFSNDVAQYSQFLQAAAEEFEAAEDQGTAEAEEQGQIF